MLFLLFKVLRISLSIAKLTFGKFNTISHSNSIHELFSIFKLHFYSWNKVVLRRSYTKTALETCLFDVLTVRKSVASLLFSGSSSKLFKLNFQPLTMGSWISFHSFLVNFLTIDYLKWRKIYNKANYKFIRLKT